MTKPHYCNLCPQNKLLRPNKKISVFPVTGLKILGSVGDIFFFNYFFPENLKKILGFTSKFW